MTIGKIKYPTDRHGWAEFLPERNVENHFSGMRRVPWVVVGAGITGLACARRLAQLNNGQEILLVDARLVAQGASGRNSGFAVAVSHFSGGFNTPQIENYRRINRINQAGLDLLRSQVSSLAIDCQWHEDGFHHVAADRLAINEYRHFLRYLDTLKVDHVALDQQKLDQRLGTSHYQVGIHVRAGALVQPAALVRGLADKLPDNVTLYEQSPVLRINRGSPLVLELEHGEIKADNVVLATNYEASKLGVLRNYIIGSTLSGSFTRILDNHELASLGDLKQWGVLSLHNGGATVRLTGEGRLCLRNTAQYQAARLLDEKQLAGQQKIHRAAFEKRFPQLKNVPLEYGWSGVEGISRNATNYFGRQADNIYYAGCYNGSGLSRGTAFGSALADYACGKDTPLIADCLGSARGQWFPPRPILDVGAFFGIRSRFKGVGLDR